MLGSTPNGAGSSWERGAEVACAPRRSSETSHRSPPRAVEDMTKRAKSHTDLSEPSPHCGARVARSRPAPPSASPSASHRHAAELHVSRVSSRSTRRRSGPRITRGDASRLAPRRHARLQTPIGSGYRIGRTRTDRTQHSHPLSADGAGNDARPLPLQRGLHGPLRANTHHNNTHSAVEFPRQASLALPLTSIRHTCILRSRAGSRRVSLSP